MNPANNFASMAIMTAFRISIGSLAMVEALGTLGWIYYAPDYTWFWLLVVSLAWWAVTEWAWRRDVGHSSYLMPVLVFVAVASDALGDIFHFYSTVPYYDKYLHFGNSAIVTCLVYFASRKAFETSRFPTAMQAVLTACVGSTLGALYEVEEYLEDVLVNHHQIRLGDGYDTAGDLLMDITGSLLAAALACAYAAYRKRSGAVAPQEFSRSETLLVREAKQKSD